MSKDIRLFFVSGKKLNTPSQETKKKVVQRKRSAVVIDSDSDEEPLVLSSKRTKASTVEDQKSKVIQEKQKANNKNETKVASKYFTGEKVNAADVFGARPVKRDNSRNIIKKVATPKTSQEIHFNEDFEAELLLLDEVGTVLLSKDSILCKEPNCGTTRENLKKSTNDTLKRKQDSNEGENECCEIQKEKNENSRKTKDEFNQTESPKKKTEPLINNTLAIKMDVDNEIALKKIKLNDSKPSLFRLSSQNISNWSPVKTSPIKNKTLETYSPITKKSPSKPYSVKNVSSLSLDKNNVQRKKKSKTGGKLSSPKKSPSKTYRDKNVSPLSLYKNEVQRKEKSETDGKLLSPRLSKSEKICRETNENRLFSKKISTSVKDSSENSGFKSVKKEESRPTVNDQVASLSQASCNLWVDKYKPTTTKQIIGQQGDKSCVNKLTAWLKNWHKNHCGNKKMVKPSPWAKNDDGAYFKAALLSGPPGVGKTTTAHLVSRELGYDVVEFNASDTRSKKLLHQEVSELLSTNSLSPFFTGKGEGVSKKHVLLMDEVDGMAGNEDRGGVQELIQLIRQSRIPVICMCNDRNHPKIRSLANYCFDLRFSKPRAEQIKGAMMSVCFKEKLKMTPNVLTDIITSANQDIRLIINHLSMLSMESSDLANSSKHIKMGPWDITRKIFSEVEHKSMSFNDKSDLFFHDYNVTPLFVQENYLNAVPHKPEAKNKVKKMELFAAAARCLSLGDLTEKNIRSNNAWGLLPVQAIFSSLAPGEILEGHIGAQINFPAWFGKNSRQTKMSRVLQELTVHARLKISGNKEAMNLDYLTPLENSIMSPLVELGSDGIPQALSVLSEYSLIREDLEGLSELSSWPNTKNQFSEVESKVKAAFTRAYNKTSTPTPYAAVPIKKGTKSDVESMDVVTEESEEGSQNMEEEEEEDGLEVDAMIVVKKKLSGKPGKEVGPSTSKGSKNPKWGRKK